MTLKEAREMFVKSKNNLQENQTNVSLQSIFLLSKDWFEPWRRLNFLPDHAKTDIGAFLAPKTNSNSGAAEAARAE